MKKRARILIGYDGSKCADAALDDLTHAGLPPDAEAVDLILVHLEQIVRLDQAQAAAILKDWMRREEAA